MFEFKMPDAPRSRDFFETKISLSPAEVMDQDSDDVVIVDLREPKDFEAAHIPGALSLPREKWETPLALSKNKTNILYGYSQTCPLAVRAALRFASEGYLVREMEGGFAAWKEERLNVEPSAAARPPAIEPVPGDWLN